jgi:hypothetical protein
MPEFSVHIDPDDLARRDLAAAVSLPPVTADGSAQPPPTVAAHHGAQDARLLARQRSERDRAGRKSGGSARSYAFRRS